MLGMLMMNPSRVSVLGLSTLICSVSLPLPAWSGAQEWLAALPLSTIDSTIGVRLEGTVADERVGASVDIVPDVNGDRLDDVLIGAPGMTGGASNGGGGYVVFGQSGGFATSPFNLVNLAGSNGGRYVGDQADSADSYGHIVRGVGDVNGDGRNDFVISAPRATPANFSYLGTAYVIFGKDTTNWQVTDSLGNLNGSNGFRFNGEGYAGSAAAGTFDFNGDGFTDFFDYDDFVTAFEGGC